MTGMHPEQRRWRDYAAAEYNADMPGWVRAWVWFWLTVIAWGISARSYRKDLRYWLSARGASR
jgi:hypothetical protein